MGLFFKSHGKHHAPRPHFLKRAASRFHLCRIEPMEQRQLLSATVAPLHVATTYFEDSNDYDVSSTLKGTDTSVADLFEVSFVGGATGTQLTQLRIDADNTFFNTAEGGGGAYGYFPFTVVSHDGFSVVSTSVANGGTSLVLTLSGFDAGEKLVFSIDVDEDGNLESNAVAEGAEFEGATFTASFTAAHMQDITTPTFTFYDKFSLAGTGLEDALPNDNYDNVAALKYVPSNSSPGPVYTAAASGSVTQTPLPITLSGVVYSDLNADNKQETGDLGIAGVTLALYELDDGTYVSTGKTALTDSTGAYKFTGLLPGTYQVVETQPDGYLSVGDTPGTVNGETRGVVSTVDILTSISLEGGDTSVRNDFAEVKPASLSGYVYEDANNNGVYDTSETPIAYVQLTLVDAGGETIDVTTMTDEQGYYHFDGLMPGTYSVVEAQPDGYLDGLDAAGTAGGNAHNPGDLIDGITLAGGQSGLNYDFGEILPSSLSGYVYCDANNNGVFEADEAPIAGVLVTLVDASGKSTGQTATTDDSGFYFFENLAPGTYGVVETQPSGYLDGLDTVGTAGGTAHNPGDRIDGIVLAGGTSSKENNFGELLPASISGQVFVDNNGNNALDSGETLLGDVTIWLLNSNGERVVSTTTDGYGKYSFTDLTPGTYGVEEIQPAGYLEGGDRVGSAGGQLDGDDRILSAQLDAGVDGVSYDFWEVVPATISGYVFQDGPTITLKQGQATPYIPSIRDGKLTADDTRLSGVTLELCDATGSPLLNSNGNPITTTTDENGYYQFTGLRAGQYSIVEIQPAGYTTGVDTAGSAGGVVVNCYSDVEASVLSTLAVTTTDNAIVLISINPGETAVQYNFSEVLIETEKGGSSTLPPLYPDLPPPMPTWPADYQAMGGSYYMAPPVIRQLIGGGGGSPGGYTWHLSVIDAGQPREESSGEEFVQVSQVSESGLFDPVSWTGAELDQSVFILANADGVPIKKIRFGIHDATPVTGDWDGDGTTKVGVFLDGYWFLDLNGNGVWDKGDLWVKLGKKGDQPVTGDWNGDGKTDVGIFGPTWIGDTQAIVAEPGLPDSQNPPTAARPKNVPPDPTQAAVGYRTMKKGQPGKLRSDLVDHVFQYGEKGDIAITGDWNGDGIRTIGIFRNGTWFLDVNGNGRWDDVDIEVDFGQAGDIPVVGDWTGDGVAKLGVYRNGTFYLDTNNNRQIDASDKVIQLGHAGDKPVVGDWDGDGIDKVGVYENAPAAPAEVPLQASR